MTERASTAYRPVRGAPWLAAVLNHIESHLSDSLATAQLSEFAGKSHTALDAAFRKNFGVSPGRYVLQLRMKTARRLLASGGLSVKEVASRTGFASHPYFSRTYRNWYGRSPTDDLPASVRKRQPARPGEWLQIVQRRLQIMQVKLLPVADDVCYNVVVR